MGFIVNLRDDTETVDFLSDDYRLMDSGLVIGIPEQKEVWGGDSVFAQGEQLVESSFKNREATVTFQVTGLTRDELLQNVARIDRMIERAKRRSIEETGTRVEFIWALDETRNITYFEVVSGELAWPENVMSVEQVHQQTGARTVGASFLPLSTLAAMRRSPRRPFVQEPR